MSVKKQIPSLCKLYSFEEKKQEEILARIDIDSCFYYNIFDIFQSQCRKVRVDNGSNKKFFAIKLLQFSYLETQQRYIFPEKVNISK